LAASSLSLRANPPPVQRSVNLLQNTKSENSRRQLLKNFQHKYGNAYAQQVARALQNSSSEPVASNQVQRVCAPPAPPKPKLAPAQAPGFNLVKAQTKQLAQKEKNHPPAKTKANEAQAAASGPPNEVASQAAAGQVDEMSHKKPGTFDKQAFVKAVKEAIQAATPQSLQQVEDFKSSNKAGEVKGKVSNLVTKGKDASAKDIKETSQATPDASKANPKKVTPMKLEEPGALPVLPAADKALPPPKDGSETSLDNAKCQVDDQMQTAGVTEQQLKKSNEPEFNKALGSKKEVEANADKAPKAYRAQEKAILGKAKGEAKVEAGKVVQQMHQGRTGVLSKVAGNKDKAKSQDESKRAEVSKHIEDLYSSTKKEVEGILSGLDSEVNQAFDKGESSARSVFQDHVDREMKRYKEERYSGAGAVLWVTDSLKITSLPDKVNAFYREGREMYLERMDKVINNVAEVVGKALTKATNRIQQGRKDIKDYVAKLPKDLQKVGQEAQEKFESQFDELDQKVSEKQSSLVDSLAQKYVAARDALDADIEKRKEENKGLLDKAKDAISGVIETINKLKDMLLGVLARAVGAIDKIIKDPIGFLNNLVGAVKNGLGQFVGNIGEHLKKGLLGWLFGALAEAGIQMPQTFDLKGILSLILQVLGLTYTNIRERAVKIVGPKVIEGVEKASELFVIIKNEGIGGLWNFIKDKISDLKDTVMSGIKDFITDSVIKAGVSWLIGMLNPAGAFIKACQSIYNIIMFFVERGSQIMELVNSIIDSINDIASGSIGNAANAVEKALSKALPVAISFLANLLGLGGISEKIKTIIQKIQSPINKVIDKVVNFAVKPFKKLAASKLLGKAKEKYQQGKAWVKNKAQQGVNWVKGKAKAGTDWVKGKLGIGKGKDKSKPDKRDKTQKDADEAKAMSKAYKLLQNKNLSSEEVKKKLPGIKSKYNMAQLELVTESKTETEETDHVEGEIQRAKTTGVTKVLGKKTLSEMAQELSGKIGRNSVKFETSDVKGRIDLAGKAHFDKATQQYIPTPHVQTKAKHISPNGIPYLGTEITKPATKADIRLAKKLAKQQGLL